MKNIKFSKEKETVTINGEKVEIEICTINLLKIAINSPIQGGFSVNDMLARVKLLNKVEEAEKNKLSSLELEDYDYKNLHQIILDSKWSIVSKKIAEFVSSFEK